MLSAQACIAESRPLSRPLPCPRLAQGVGLMLPQWLNSSTDMWAQH
jgi:hypothetical protein